MSISLYHTFFCPSNLGRRQTLKNEIRKNAVSYPVKTKGIDDFGTSYEQKNVLYGRKDKPANVIVGWKENNGKTWLTSLYVTDEN